MFIFLIMEFVKTYFFHDIIVKFHDISMTFPEKIKFHDISMTFHDKNIFPGFPGFP